MNTDEHDLPKMYRHFKGDCYIVVKIAKHHANGTEWAVYRPVGDESTFYVRPFAQFNELVHAPHSDSKVRRFQPLDNAEANAVAFDLLLAQAHEAEEAATTDEDKMVARMTTQLIEKLKSKTEGA